MDLWVVAAAAGAGYIAKNLQNLSVDKKENLGESTFRYAGNAQSSPRNLLQQLRERTCPLRKLAQNRAKGGDASLDVEDHSNVEIDRLSNRDSEAGLASSGADAHEYYNLGSISSSPSVFSAEENLVFEDGESRKLSRVRSGKLGRIRKRRECLIRPLSSLGSCLDAQLCREHEILEGNMSGLVPSIVIVRPMLVADGSRISRSSSDSSLLRFESCREEMRKENGDSLEQFESVVELQMKREKCSGSLLLNGSSIGASGRSFHSQGPDGMVLFIIGMTIGILSATMTSKKDIDELNEQLKQKQNLVQDLHEELDMKEMVTVKELINLGHLPPGETNTPPSIPEPIASPSYIKVDDITKFDGVKVNDITTENPELMSEIEAELQAELEMLEQNMETSARNRISDVLELDPDFEPDIAQGDLKPLMANDDASESGNDATDTTTTIISQPVNYVVCPWELSFRLHELIEFRLEERIKELERALGNNQNRVQFLSSRSIDVGERSYYNRTESPSTPSNPTCMFEQDGQENSNPIKNISSNNMDAYKNPNGILQNNEDYRIFNRDEEYDSISHHISFMEEDKSRDLVRDMPQILDTETWTSFMSNEDCRSEDDGTDESEMLLIKKILERRKSGSYVALEF